MNPRDTRHLINNYKQLGCAIIEQAIRDYWADLVSEEYLYNFLYGTLWVQCLDLDIDYLYNLALDRKEKMEDAKKERKAKRQSVKKLDG